MCEFGRNDNPRVVAQEVTVGKTNLYHTVEVGTDEDVVWIGSATVGICVECQSAVELEVERVEDGVGQGVAVEKHLSFETE